jgi:uncharacterized protein YajQ (UPF0234 family)
LQFPIAVGDKVLMVFSKDTVEDWLGGDVDFIFDSNFDINNGFAIVGINDNTNAIPIKTYVDFKVNKIKIRNSSDELITVLSETEQALSDTNEVLSKATVTVTGGSSAGTYAVDQQSEFAALKIVIDALKARLDTFKV